jgi:hypothetical protein
LQWWQKPFFLAWWFLIGERGSWGLASVVVDTVAGHPPQAGHVRGAIKGKFEGIFLPPSPANGNG